MNHYNNYLRKNYMTEPKKLNLWDRFFNRYREEPLKEIEEKWYKTYQDRRLKELID